MNRHQLSIFNNKKNPELRSKPTRPEAEPATPAITVTTPEGGRPSPSPRRKDGAHPRHCVRGRKAVAITMPEDGRSSPSLRQKEGEVISITTPEGGRLTPSPHRHRRCPPSLGGGVIEGGWGRRRPHAIIIEEAASRKWRKEEALCWGQTSLHWEDKGWVRTNLCSHYR